ncbi:MAG: hypothetical protein DRR11_14570 [Gammaproteobacteria bacterium]|nr:MAG: hypothetical protein DRR11_14570 [Gammaproteobacteria bacterium]
MGGEARNNHEVESDTTSLRARRARQSLETIVGFLFAGQQPERGCRVAALLAMTSVLTEIAVLLRFSQ